jgi:hypothetical protein
VSIYSATTRKPPAKHQIVDITIRVAPFDAAKQVNKWTAWITCSCGKQQARDALAAADSDDLAQEARHEATQEALWKWAAYCFAPELDLGWA